MSAASGASDPDRRTERTRQAIRASFFDLLQQRGFARTTIAEVVVRANVGRSTFYEHYKTKHDLLSQSVAAPFATLAAIIGNPQPPPPLIPLLQHFRQNQALGRELFLSQPTRLLMCRALTRHIAPRLADLRAAHADADPVIPENLIAIQLAETQLTLVQAWAFGKTSCRVEHIATALCVSCHALTRALLGMDGLTGRPDRDR